MQVSPTIWAPIRGCRVDGSFRAGWARGFPSPLLAPFAQIRLEIGIPPTGLQPLNGNELKRGSLRAARMLRIFSASVQMRSSRGYLRVCLGIALDSHRGSFTVFPKSLGGCGLTALGGCEVRPLIPTTWRAAPTRPGLNDCDKPRRRSRSLILHNVAASCSNATRCGNRCCGLLRSSGERASG